MHRPLSLVFLSPLLCAVAGLEAQQPQLVEDFNQGTVATPSYPSPGGGNAPWQRQQFTRVLDYTYFTAYHPQRGVELYLTRGTPQSTRLVMDIYPGDESGMPQHMCSAAWRLFFTARGASAGRELWVAEPYSDKCYMVRDLVVGSGNGSSDPRDLFFFETGVLFQASDEHGDWELYRSDGTARGTFRIADLLPGPISSSPRNFFRFGQRVAFHAFDGETVRLWITDGTAQGTYKLGNTRVDRNAASMAVFGGRLFFAGLNASHGLELWSTDGTEAGTRLELDLYAGLTGSEPHELMVLDGALWFSATGTVPGQPQTPTGEELWCFDGEKLRLFDLHPGPFSSGPELYIARGRGHRAQLFFTADGALPGTAGPSMGREVWVADRRGMRLLDLMPGAEGSGPFSLVEGPGGDVYFVSGSGKPGRLVFRTDGSIAGTRLLRRFNQLEPQSGDGAAYLTTMSSGELLLMADDGVHGSEPWVSDGTARGSRLLADINPTRAQTLGAHPIPIARAHGMLYFQAQRESFEPYIYATPTRSRTILEVPSLRQHGIRDVLEAQTVGDKLFLAAHGSDAQGASVGAELWVLSPGGKLEMIDIFSGTVSSYPQHMCVLRDKLLFAAEGDLHSTSPGGDGRELWISDGTRQGTRMLADLHPGFSLGFGKSSFPAEMTAVGAHVYFVAETPAHGKELWVTDGTRAGTHLVVDADPGVGSGRVRCLTRVGQRLYFQAVAPDTGCDLWVAADGGQQAHCVDLAAGALSAFPALNNGATYPMFAFGDTLVLAAEGDANLRAAAGHGVELWRTDGTRAGSQLVADTFAGNATGSPGNFAMLGADRFVFFANDGFGLSNYRPGLYVSDGTPLGTHRVVDLDAGFQVTGQQPVVSFGSRHVLFAAPKAGTWGIQDADLMITDGTKAGTLALFGDLYLPTLRRGGALGLQAEGDRFYVVRETDALGAELWFVEGIAASQQLPVGCTGQSSDPRLRVADPVLGRADVDAHLCSERPQTPGLLMLGSWAGSRTEVVPGCRTQMSLSSSIAALPILTDAHGNWRRPIQLGLAQAGIDHFVQVGLLASNARGFVLSNGVVATPGK